jgi:fatty acid desaturase
MTVTAATTTQPGPADVVAAHRLVQDLFAPNPWLYWRELAVTGTLAWAALLVAASVTDPLAVPLTAAALAGLLWYRAVAMIHELTHQRCHEIRGFHLAWNLVVGVPWLLPSIMYEGVHTGHHKKTTYGTAADPEYLPFAGRPGAILRYLGFSFLIFPGLLLRFLVAAPVSWLVPPLRRLLIRSASSYVINLGYVRTMTAAEQRRLLRWECVILLAWWPPVALTLAGVLPWRWLACWYAIYTTVLLVNRVRMLTAHHFALDGGTPTDHLGQFADSVDTPAGWWAELWAPLGMRYHALHHLFPTLPFHNLRAAYDRLTGQLPPGSFYRGSTGRGLVWSLRGIVTGSKRRQESV